ncbi:MAG TPA: hypothetical protein VIM33_16795 [Gaiellaceae bacterium]|jgi:hypothetical protein
MYGLTRATTTLVFSAGAGLLIWFATQISNDNIGGYWARVGLVAGAGLLMALSQLLGGWTKWGWPRLSIAVLITAFIPVAIVSLWIILAGEPGSSWFHNHVMSWSRGIHVSGLVTDFLYYIPVLAFGTGLVFGFSFDTTGPVVRDRDVIVDRDREAAPVDGRRGLFGRRRTVTPTTTDGQAADEPMTAEREATTTSTDRTTDRETVK